MYINLKFLNHAIWLTFKNDLVGQMMNRSMPQGMTAKQFEGYLNIFISPAFIACAGIFGNMITGMMTGIFVSLALKQDDPFKNEGKF